MNNNNNKRRQNNMGGGGQRHNNNRPRRFNNNGGSSHRSGSDDPANIARTRRNAMQSREKYQNMARDAMSMGDRVLAENYLQHADHYYRVLAELPPEEVRQPYQPRHVQQGQGENGNDVTSANGNGLSEQSHHTGEALPSFITHSSSQDNLSQENL